MTNNKNGYIELIVGCMFAGKTSELIRRISVFKNAGIETIIFKPKFDWRKKEFGKLTTHDGQEKYDVFFVNKVEEVKKILDSKKIKPKILAFDEVQFLIPEFVSYIEELANEGFYVICAGLDKGFNDKLFVTVLRLMSLAEFITKLKAICSICGDMAFKTQRIDEKNKPIGPNKLEKLKDVIGGKEVYQARCRKHFVIFNE